MAYYTSFVPLWRETLLMPPFSSRFIENNEKTGTDIAGNHSQPGVFHKPKFFSPVVIYQNSKEPVSEKLEQRSANGIPQQRLPICGLKDTIPIFSKECNFRGSVNCNTRYFNSVECNSKPSSQTPVATFPCKCVLQPFEFTAQSFNTNVPDILSTRPYKTPQLTAASKNTENYFHHQSSSKVRANKFYKSAFRRPFRQNETKYQQKASESVEQNISKVFHHILHPERQHPKPGLNCLPGWDKYCFFNSLPISYSFSSTITSAFSPLQKLDANNALKSKRANSKNSTKSNNITMLGSYHQAVLESSKVDAGKVQRHKSKKETLSSSATRPFTCQCGRTFARNEELTRHQRIHSGYKPHRCHICFKLFGRKDHLNKHVKTHLHSSQKKVHLCNVPNCGQSYTRSDALARHQMNSHGIRAKPSKWRPHKQAA